eukprot:287965_1
MIKVKMLFTVWSSAYAIPNIADNKSPQKKKQYSAHDRQSSQFDVLSEFALQFCGVFIHSFIPTQNSNLFVYTPHFAAKYHQNDKRKNHVYAMRSTVHPMSNYSGSPPTDTTVWYGVKSIKLSENGSDKKNTSNDGDHHNRESEFGRDSV